MNDTALLIIDVQKGLDDPALGQRNNPDAEANMARLLKHWREFQYPIVHVQHHSTEPDSPLRPELPGNAIKDVVQPLSGETHITKSCNSAFIGTDLENHLKMHGIDSLVIVGLTTDHCVSASTRMASDLGFQVVLVSDATATHDRVGPDGHHYSAEDMHRINLASLNGEFCRVMSSDDILALVAS